MKLGDFKGKDKALKALDTNQWICKGSRLAADFSKPTHKQGNDGATFFLIQWKYEPRILNPILNYQDYRKALLTSMNLENTTPSQPFLRILCEVKLYLPSHDWENSSKRIYETHLKIFRCTSWTKIKVQLNWRQMCKYYYSDKTEIIQLKNVRWRKK